MCVRRGGGRGGRMKRGEGRVEKNAPLKAEWKLTPAPKWLRVRPPPPLPPHRVTCSPHSLRAAWELVSV